MQFFVGLKEFSTAPIFDPSLFVEIRKRVGAATFDALNVSLINSISQDAEAKHNVVNQEEKDNHDQSREDTGNGKEVKPTNKGKPQLDATVADQYITYATDSKLLNASRKQSEKMIDKLYALNDKRGTKPRTYRKTMDTAFFGLFQKEE